MYAISFRRGAIGLIAVLAANAPAFAGGVYEANLESPVAEPQDHGCSQASQNSACNREPQRDDNGGDNGSGGNGGSSGGNGSGNGSSGGSGGSSGGSGGSGGGSSGEGG